MLVLLTFQDGSSGNCDPTVIPTPQNLEGNSVDRNMYPHGIMDYCNVSFFALYVYNFFIIVSLKFHYYMFVLGSYELVSCNWG